MAIRDSGSPTCRALPASRSPRWGWKTRGHGPMGTCKGVLLHHTAGPKTGNMPSLGVVTNGRPDLAGPLCNTGLGRDGTCLHRGRRRAYHAGAGSWHGVTAGNSELIGIEAENAGDGQAWPSVQIDAYVRLCAAVLKQIGADPIMAWRIGNMRFRRGGRSTRWHRHGRLPASGRGDHERRRRPGRPSRRPMPRSGRTLRRGMSGDDVAALQKAIGVVADGDFGPGTEAALRAFQRISRAGCRWDLGS
jgi:hypothetical protein